MFAETQVRPDRDTQERHGSAGETTQVHQTCNIVLCEDRKTGDQWWEARLAHGNGAAPIASSPRYRTWPWREGWKTMLTLFKPVTYCVDRCIEDDRALRAMNRALVAELSFGGWRPVVSDPKGNVVQMRRHVTRE